MIPDFIQRRLQKNWGDKAEAMACKVECRLYDIVNRGEWFLYAQDPSNPDVILAIKNDWELDPAARLLLSELDQFHDYRGNFLQLDDEYRPRNAAIVYEELRKWKEL